MILGTDVNRYNKRIDFTKMRQADIRFCYIRTSVGLAEDPMFKYYLQQSRATGIFRTAYHAFKLHRTPREQAEFFCDIVAREEDKGLYLDIPPMLDVESKIADPFYGNKVRACLEVIESTSGWRPIIYTSKSVWDGYVKPKDDWPRSYQLHVAHWNRNVEQPLIPSSWDSWLIWQYGQDPGAKYGVESSLVDVNRFNGGILSFYFWMMVNRYLRWRRTNVV